MLKFDLKDIQGLPNNANIVEASLDLYFIEGDPGIPDDLCSLFVIARYWNSTEVTWNHATKNDPWEQLDSDTRFFSNEVGDTVEYPGGGDRLFPCAATAPLAPKTDPWESYQITEVIKKYVKEPDNFHGLLLKPYLGNSSRWYASSEYKEKEKRPKLIIKYSGTGIGKNPEQTLVTPCQFRLIPQGMQLYLPQKRYYNVKISDLKGKILHTFTSYGEKWYTLPELPMGTYVLHAASNNAAMIHTFMVFR